MGMSDKLFVKGKREKVESVSERLVVKVDFSSWIPASLQISPDSKRVAYAAGEKGKQFVVVDGEEGKRYDEIVKGTPIFSPDDPDSIRYLASLGSSICMVEARAK